jgi:hypothetical protein
MVSFLHLPIICISINHLYIPLTPPLPLATRPPLLALPALSSGIGAAAATATAFRLSCCLPSVVVQPASRATPAASLVARLPAAALLLVLAAILLLLVALLLLAAASACCDPEPPGGHPVCRLHILNCGYAEDERYGAALLHTVLPLVPQEGQAGGVGGVDACGGTAGREGVGAVSKQLAAAQLAVQVEAGQYT